MIYRLKPQQGDTVAVPQLVFARLGAAEEASVRVALYVLATGVTDPDNLRVDRETPSGNDFLQGALDRPRRHKRKD